MSEIISAGDSPTNKKIGGWLYLVGLSVTVGPLLTLSQVFSYHLKMFYDGSWTNLTSQASEVYHPIYFPTLTMELFSTVFLLFFQLIQLFLFFKKDARFPKVFSYFLILSAVSATFLCISIYLYPHPDQAVLQTQVKGMVRAIIGGCIWILYMKKSVRVKETFTNKFTILGFLSQRKIYFIPLIVLCLFFVWSVSSKNKTKAVEKSVSQSPELDSKEIADRALVNLVVIEPINKKGEIIGIGSGFFISPDLIVTNTHVLEKAEDAYIRFPNSQSRDSVAQVVAFDRATDIALLRPKKFRSDLPLMLANTDKVSVGSKIYTAGNPEGLEGTFSNGLVSNKQRYEGIDIIQISAPISHGSSGGPVLDGYGNVVGVTRAFLKNGQNLNLAIPSVYIARLIMRTEEFYPLSENSELKLNPSISKLFPQVCDYLVDIALPEKHFLEFSEKDMKDKDLESLCKSSMPSCKRAWYNKSTGGAVFIGSLQLPADKIANISHSRFEDEVTAVISATKDAYRKTNPETQFKSSQKDLNSYTLRYDLEATYSEDGEVTTDHRSLYFVLPYCRLDVLYTASGKRKDIDGAIFNILTDSFVKELPGAKSEKALFKFSK